MPKTYKAVGKRQMARRVTKQLNDTLERCSLRFSVNVGEVGEDNIIPHSNILTAFNTCTFTSNIHNNAVNRNVILSNNNMVSCINVDATLKSQSLTLNTSDVPEYLLESSDLSERHSKYDLNVELQKWAVRKKVAHSVTTDLLHVLHPVHPELPLSSKTLLNTPTSITLKTELISGSYIHFGLNNYLQMLISKNNFIFLDDIEISFNIDGLPLFKSSSVQFWPILGLIKNSKIKLKPFAIGVFCGKSKPSPIADFLNSFVDDLKSLTEEGLLFKNKKYKIIVHTFICDAPARAFIKCIKTHTGYSGCDKCTEEGNYYKHRMIFNNTIAPRRSDESFLLETDQNHHTGVSPLVDLGIGMVSKFPVDSMHCLYLGVMKKLLLTWTGGDLRVRLCGREVLNISEKLIFYKDFVISEFNRKPRSLSDLARFKATEFRTFLVYVGIIVLKDINKAIYEHFLLLHVAATILLCKRHLRNFGCDVGKSLLDNFISHSKVLYGLDFLVYNVHALCHLSEDAQLFGPLDEVSAFPFENYLGEIKKTLKSPNKPLEQLFCRLTESNNVSLLINDTDAKNKCQMQHFNGPVLTIGFKKIMQYKKIEHNNCVYTISGYSIVNCYCLIRHHTVIKINNIIVNAEKEIFLVGQKFMSYKSFYVYPFESKDLDICVVGELLPEMELFPLSSVITKCMLFPVDPPHNTNKWLSLPLVHCSV